MLKVPLHYKVGQTDLYMCVFSPSGQVRDVVNVNWEAFDDAQIDNYDVPFVEVGDKSGFYEATFPILAAGVYPVTAYQGDKGDPNDDKVIGGGVMHWDGSAEIDVSTVTTIITWVQNVLEGDLTIDISTTPWQAVVKTKGTDTELIRKDLKDKDGNDIVNVNALIGKYLEP